MPSYFEEFTTKDGDVVRAFHDSSDCLKGEEHDWGGWQDHFDYCTHEGPHALVRIGCCPSGGEAVCTKCGMGAMHHSLMTAE